MRTRALPLPALREASRRKDTRAGLDLVKGGGALSNHVVIRTC